MSVEIIAADKVVLFHYTLRDSDGDVLDSSDGADPLPYLHGAGNIVPGLERQMTGRVVGDSFTAVVSPEEGYGVRDGLPQPVPRDAFPEDVELEEGMQFMAEGPDGDAMPLWIAAIEADMVFVDKNHPLAGETLHFAIEIVGIREATAAELEHGHPHGADGTDVHEHDDDDYDDDEDYDDDDLDEDDDASQES